MVNIDGLSFGYGRGALIQGARARAYARQHLRPARRQRRRQVDAAEAHVGVAVRHVGHGSLARPRSGRAPAELPARRVRAARGRAGAEHARPATIVRTRAPFYPRFDHALFDRYLREFELPQDGNLAALSHGQQKKFLLAFGFASQAKLVLLDEPTNGLDIPSKSLLRRVVAEALTADRLFVISTHQVRDLGTLMDPIVILHQGRVLLNRTLAEIGARVHMTQQSSPPAAGRAGSVVQRAGGRRVLVGVARRRRRAARSRGAVQRDRREAGSRRSRCSQPREVPRERPALVAALAVDAAQRRAARLPLVARRSRARRSAGRAAWFRSPARADGIVGTALSTASFFIAALFAWGTIATSVCVQPICTAAATNTAFLLLPASALEKTVSRLLLDTVGFIVCLLVLTTVLSWVLEGHQYAACSACGASSSRRSIASPWLMLPHFLVAQGAVLPRAPRGFARSSS